MSTPAAVSPDATFALKFPSELAIPFAAVGVRDIPTMSMMIPPMNGGIDHDRTGYQTSYHGADAHGRAYRTQRSKRYI